MSTLSDMKMRDTGTDLEADKTFAPATRAVFTSRFGFKTFHREDRCEATAAEQRGQKVNELP